MTSIDSEAEDLIRRVFADTLEVFVPAPARHDEFQPWARARKAFIFDGGVRAAAINGTDARRQRSSRLRKRLEAAGILRIDRVARVSQFVRLSPAGLDLAERLTGTTSPADLREATQRMEPGVIA